VALYSICVDRHFWPGSSVAKIQCQGSNLTDVASENTELVSNHCPVVECLQRVLGHMYKYPPLGCANARREYRCAFPRFICMNLMSECHIVEQSK
jgi:hypothetical protein